MPYDWWGLRHKIADGDPLKYEAVGRLTLPQLCCLASERPPSRGTAPQSAGDHERLRAERLARDEEWNG